jgi:hypothetical protein
MATQQGVGAGEHGLAGAFARPVRTPPAAKCRYLGQSECQDRRKRGLRGYDNGKRVKGRKHQMLVDTQGLVLKAYVHAANVSDSEGGQHLLTLVKGKLPRLSHVWIEQGYKAACVAWVQ